MKNTGVIAATFSEWKMIKTRKVLQIVLELPLEQQGEVYQTLGVPLPDQEIWVAVARLDMKAGAVKQVEDMRPAAKLSQLAGILCHEGGFQRFVAEQLGDHEASEDNAADYIRLVCSVKSRADIDKSEFASGKFRELRASYQAWLKDPVPA